MYHRLENAMTKKNNTIKKPGTIRTPTNKTNILWAKKVPGSQSNFDQLISIDTEGTARYRVTPYPVKVETKLNTISLDEMK